MEFTKLKKKEKKIADFYGKSVALFCVRTLVGPIVRRKADAPEAWIWFRELQGDIEFFGLSGRDELDRAFCFIARSHV